MKGGYHRGVVVGALPLVVAGCILEFNPDFQAATDSSTGVPPMTTGSLDGSLDGPTTQATETSGVTTTTGTGDDAAESSGGLPPVEIEQLCAAADHTCALDDSGAVWCWGSSRFGQLGTGDWSTRSEPALVPGLPGPAVDISCGPRSTCVVLNDGRPWCWGDHMWTGSDAQVTAEPLVDLDEVDEIAVSQRAACARLDSDDVLCWGSHDVITLGQVYADSPALYDIECSASHCCARDDGDALWCWGQNHLGQLGSMLPLAVTEPTQVPMQSPVRVSVADNRTCIIDPTGALRCAGQGFAEPFAVVSNIEDAVAVDAGAGCAATDDGDLRCWGASALAEPRQSPGVDVDQLVAGRRHGCILADSEVLCWGDDHAGQLGHGTTAGSAPVEVASLMNAIDIDVRAGSSCAVQADGTLWCWGRNDAGQLGDGTRIDAPTPTRAVPSLREPLVEVGVGLGFACARSETGAVWCWGANNRGQLGDGTGQESLLPVPTSLPAPAVQLAVARTFACALDEAAALRCWGDGSRGALGLGDTDDRLAPTQVPSPAAGWQHIAVGHEHACGQAGEEVWCWGTAYWGALGLGGEALGGATPSLVPLPVGARRLAADGRHTCVITVDDALWCWGYNDENTFGLDPDDRIFAPARQLESETARGSLFLGESSTCVVDPRGQARCSGRNDVHQLGHPSRGRLDDFTPCLEELSDIAQLAVGDDHGCARTEEGQVYCFGNPGTEGRLGDGSVRPPVAPRPVRIPPVP